MSESPTSRPAADPARWLTDLMSTQSVMWPSLDVADTSKALAAATAPWTKAVADVTAMQMGILQQMAAPWLAAMGTSTSGAEPIKDRRFSGEAWTKDPRFEAVARTYLTQTELMQKALDAAPLDERSKAQWGFALRQVMDALSPANTLVTNPEALQLAMETGGASLVEGLKLFTQDLAKGSIAMTDESAFELGRNVGTTPGAVVFQNELMQLIQYTPTTERVHQRPLVIIPPCINKYYILDLQPANSFVAHARRPGAHGVPRVVAQRRLRPEHPDVGRLPVRRCAEGAGGRAGDQRGRSGEHGGLLHRRDPARERARGGGCARRASRREHDAADDDARLQRHR